MIIALLHDILITIGIYSLTGREVTTSTVAAVLTVLGYSIYDTIIIFDRVRENIPIMRRSSFATIANVSLWETIRRSLATTFITLLPIAALLLFGGDTLKDFAFALIVGIASGAYSSIFIAAPLLTMLKEREPEYRRRIGVDVIEKGVGGNGLLSWRARRRGSGRRGARGRGARACPGAAVAAPEAPRRGREKRTEARRRCGAGKTLMPAAPSVTMPAGDALGREPVGASRSRRRRRRADRRAGRRAANPSPTAAG